MSELDFLKAAVLGVVQGLTEFLPVSSSAHLALIQRWFGLEPDSPPLLLFDVVSHVGSVIAVAMVFAASFRRYFGRLMRETTSSWRRPRIAWRIAILGVTASIPTAAIGLAFKDRFEAAFDNPTIIGVCLLVTGCLLAALVMIGRGRRGWTRFRWWQAGLVGVMQGLAILPGISRSGSTICAASYCGLRRRWAAEFSFFIAVPAILGATVLKLRDTMNLPPDQLSAIPWGPVLLGGVISMVVGVVALKLLLGAVRRAKLHYFAVYCWLLGAAVLWFVRR